MGPRLPVCQWSPRGVGHSRSSQCLLLRSHCLALLQLSRIVLWQCQRLKWKETITQWEPSTCFRLELSEIATTVSFCQFLPGKDMHPWFNRYLLSQALSGVEKIRGKKEKNGLCLSLASYNLEGTECWIRKLSPAKQPSLPPVSSAPVSYESGTDVSSSYSKRNAFSFSI